MNNIILSTLKSIVFTIFRIKVYGSLPVLKSDRGALIISNHESFLDGFVLGLFLKPINPVFIVHTTVVKNKLFKFILSFSEYYTIDPTSPLAMKQVIKLINSGRNVVIFPEGRITTTGSLMKVYDGPAFVAYKTGAQVIPVRLEGPQYSLFSRMSKSHPRKLLPKIKITVLQPVFFEEPIVSKSSEKRQLAGVKLKHVMENMLFESTHLLSIYETFRETMSTFGGSTIIAEDMRQTEFSYNKINKEIIGLSHLFSKHTEVDDTVGLILPNLITTFSIFTALNASLRVPAFINYTSGYEGIKSAIETGVIKTVVTSRKFLQMSKVDTFFNQIVEEKNLNVLYLEDLKGLFGTKDKLWLFFIALRFNLLPKRVNIGRPAAIIFTSGSEGKPKGVVLSHKAILSNVAQIKSVVSFNSEDKVFNALPMFHSFGLTAGTILPILTGTKIFLYPSPLHYKIIPEIVYDRGCTILFGTNTFLSKYALYAHPHDFYSLRYVVAGAEKLSETTINTWFDKFGIRILEGYGATETAPVLAVNTPTEYKKGSVGRFLPSVRHYLKPVEGIEEGGQLLVNAPNLMSGYLKNDLPGVLQHNTSELGADWYDTGDIVNVDDQGFVFIKGRMKRFAKIAGEMVSLEYPEKMALDCSPSHTHASIAIPDASKGEAVILFTTDKDITKQDLLKSARKLGFTELSVPQKIVILEAIPILGTGKIDYVTIKTMLP